MKRFKSLKRLLRFSLKLSAKPLYISAGMPRSGSTFLFNILREILLSKWDGGLRYGLLKDVLEMPAGAAYLVKTHSLNRFYRIRSQKAFYTYRDVRVAAVSRMRMFKTKPSMDNIRNDINEYIIAKRCCDLIVKYEDLTAKPDRVVEDCANLLNIMVDTREILAKLSRPASDFNESSGYSKERLLHQGHFTGTKDDEWRTVLSEELQKQLNDEFAWWFEECGYPGF